MNKSNHQISEAYIKHLFLILCWLAGRLADLGEAQPGGSLHEYFFWNLAEQQLCRRSFHGNSRSTKWQIQPCKHTLSLRLHLLTPFGHSKSHSQAQGQEYRSTFCPGEAKTSHRWQRPTSIEWGKTTLSMRL